MSLGSGLALATSGLSWILSSNGTYSLSLSDIALSAMRAFDRPPKRARPSNVDFSSQYQYRTGSVKPPLPIHGSRRLEGSGRGMNIVGCEGRSTRNALQVELAAHDRPQALRDRSAGCAGEMPAASEPFRPRHSFHAKRQIVVLDAGPSQYPQSRLQAGHQRSSPLPKLLVLRKKHDEGERTGSRNITDKIPQDLLAQPLGLRIEWIGPARPPGQIQGHKKPQQVGEPLPVRTPIRGVVPLVILNERKPLDRLCSHDGFEGRQGLIQKG